jgi:hypothetical protein
MLAMQQLVLPKYETISSGLIRRTVFGFVLRKIVASSQNKLFAVIETCSCNSMDFPNRYHMTLRCNTLNPLRNSCCYRIYKLPSIVPTKQYTAGDYRHRLLMLTVVQL